jgi:RNA polymerase sigma-70 factor (ECF subfamily)
MAEPSVTTETYETLRPLAFSIAYRMLGSVTEAEDVVQEGLLRLHRADAVEHPKAFVATVVTRLSIDELRSARARRETYVGQWLPEPIVTDSRPDDESVTTALLITLESLTPVERAVFLLHDVFDYGYDEIAEIVGKSRENCRQLALRARRHVEARRARFEASREQREKLAARFFEAVRDGDLDGLVTLLAEDAVAVGDGGGKAAARATPLRGGAKVARFMLGLARLGERRAYTYEFTELNGEPGAVIREDGAVIGTMVIEVRGDEITAIHSVVNPDKLRHLR